ncbi:MAG: hypothetical protein ACOY3L_11000 [Pseudomonadota bacterium]
MTTADAVKTMGMTRAAMARYCPAEGDLWRTAGGVTETLQGMVASRSLDSRGDDVIAEAWVRLDASLGTSGRRAIAPARKDAEGS